MKVQFLTKVLQVVFPKVWDSFPGQYSTIWRNSCGKFNENPIRTRWAWSQDPKNHEFIIYSSSFGGRRQRRQSINYPCSQQTIQPSVHPSAQPATSLPATRPLIIANYFLVAKWKTVKLLPNKGYCGPLIVWLSVNRPAAAPSTVILQLF